MVRKKKKKRKKRKKSKERKRTKPSYLKGSLHKTKIRVVGIGGGGNSIISEIARRIESPGKRKISFVVANTDSQTLKKNTTKAKRFHFGKEITHGLGTGMNPYLGREAALKEKEKISNILKNQDLLIFVACLGGGAGSGAAPVFANIAKRSDAITFGIFTLPFKFEGEKKMEIAKNALRKLRRRLNTLVVIPNERIFQVVDKKTSLTKALSMINKKLTESLEGLIKMIYQPGLINIDFADLRTILKEKGKIAYLNTVEVKGERREKEAVKELISSPLYPYTIKKAKGILFNISGEKNLKLSEVHQISRTIWELVGGRAKIIFGISENKDLKDKIKITLLAVGCKSQISFAPKKKKKKKKTKIRKKEKREKFKKGKEKNKKKSKKTKIKVRSEVSSSEKETQSSQATNNEENKRPKKVRRNALQVKKALEKEEEKILAQEKFWEPPAFLRREQK